MIWAVTYKKLSHTIMRGWTGGYSLPPPTSHPVASIFRMSFSIYDHIHSFTEKFYGLKLPGLRWGSSVYYICMQSIAWELLVCNYFLWPCVCSFLNAIISNDIFYVFGHFCDSLLPFQVQFVMFVIILSSTKHFFSKENLLFIIC